MRRLILAAVAGMVAPPLIVILFAALGVWSFQATSTPPAWERALA